MVKTGVVKINACLRMPIFEALKKFLEDNEGITATYVYNEAVKEWLHKRILFPPMDIKSHTSGGLITPPKDVERSIKTASEDEDEVRKQDEDFAFEEDEGEDSYTTRFD